MSRKNWFRHMLRTVAAAATTCGILCPQLMAQDDYYCRPADEPGFHITGGAQWLRFTRDTALSTSGPVINGPDTNLLQFAESDFDYANGYRLFLSGRGGGLRVEGIYSDLGNWQDARAGSLTTGVVFDDNLGGGFVMPNTIDTGVYFDALHIAATGGLAGEGDEDEGLGPNAGFPGDALPTYEIYYRSQLRTFELNFLTDDEESNFQFGVGYRNLQLNESAGVSILGTFRAADIAAPNGGLSHATLTGPAGLTYLGTTGNGFEDEVGNASGVPDAFVMSNVATTSNRLNGVQGIFSTHLLKWDYWTLDGVLKAGVYHNQARGTITQRYVGSDTGVGADSSAYGRTIGDTQDTVSFLGNLGLTSSIKLKNNLRFFGGYEIMFLSGIALAPDQNAAVRGGIYQTDTTGNLMTHGSSFGLEYTY